MSEIKWNGTNQLRLDLTICVSISCSCFVCVMSCIFFVSCRVLVFYKNWHIFPLIHTILKYLCFRVVLFFCPYCVFYHILIIFSYRVKFIFVLCSYRITVSCPELNKARQEAPTFSLFSLVNLPSSLHGIDTTRCLYFVSVRFLIIWLFMNIEQR